MDRIHFLPPITTYTLIYDALMIFDLNPRLTPDYARNHEIGNAEQEH